MSEKKSRKEKRAARKAKFAALPKKKRILKRTLKYSIISLVTLAVVGGSVAGGILGSIPKSVPLDLDESITQVKKVNVTFNVGNGVTGTLDNLSVEENSYFIAPSADEAGITRNLYTLLGWQESTGENNFYSVGEKINVYDSDVDFAAVWQSTLSAMFATDTGYNGADNEYALGTIPIEDGVIAELPVYEGTREGFYFAGWSRNPNSKVGFIPYDTSLGKFTVQFYGGDRDLVLYPVWEREERTLVINGYGTVRGLYGQTVTIPTSIPNSNTYYEDRKSGSFYNKGDQVLLLENTTLYPVTGTYTAPVAETATVKVDENTPLFGNFKENLAAYLAMFPNATEEDFINSGSGGYSIPSVSTTVGSFYTIALPANADYTFSQLSDSTGNAFTYFTTEMSGNGTKYLPGDTIKIDKAQVTLYPNFTFDPNRFELRVDKLDPLNYKDIKNSPSIVPNINYFVSQDIEPTVMVRYDGTRLWDGDRLPISQLTIPTTPGTYTIDISATNPDGVTRSVLLALEIYIDDALEAYLYAADYFKRDTTTFYTETMGGASPSMGGNQDVWGRRKKDAHGGFYELSTNYGASVVGIDPKVAFEAFRNEGDNVFGWREIKGSGVKSKSYPNFDGTGWTNVSNHQGIHNIIGIDNRELVYYQITSYADFNNVPTLEKIGTGYQVHFDMKPDRVGNEYKKNVAHLSGQSFNNFGRLKVTLRFDNQFRVTRIESDERYAVNAPVVGAVNSDVLLYQNIVYGFDGKLTRDNCATLGNLKLF